MKQLVSCFPKLFEKPNYWPEGLIWPPPVAPLGPGKRSESPGTDFSPPDFPKRDLQIHLPTLAGILLFFGELEQSHEISQGLSDGDGAYWHGLMHRREGDFANAGYWFRRVGKHPVHSSLGRIVNGGNWLSVEVQKYSRQNPAWDMVWMNEMCKKTSKKGEADLIKDLEILQWSEYRLLLDYSAGVELCC